jgi:hypothetical protein
MTDWTGSGTPAEVAADATQCVEYVTVAEVRDELGITVRAMSDIALQRRIDQLVGALEDRLGHGFGRALIARSSGADAVQVTDVAVIFGADAYTFEDYPTLQDLVLAVNAAGENYSLELLSHVAPNTPCEALRERSSIACGPNASNRVVLCVSYLWCQLSGNNESRVFLPLPLASVSYVEENAIELTTSYYWAVPGENWITRKACSCATSSSCYHARGIWSERYPGNIIVKYCPTSWGRVPASLTSALMDAFSALRGLGPVASESFTGYSYSRPVARAETWRETIAQVNVRPYAVRLIVP